MCVIVPNRFPYAKSYIGPVHPVQIHVMAQRNAEADWQPTGEDWSAVKSRRAKAPGFAHFFIINMFLRNCIAVNLLALRGEILHTLLFFFFVKYIQIYSNPSHNSLIHHYSLRCGNINKHVGHLYVPAGELRSVLRGKCQLV